MREHFCREIPLQLQKEIVICSFPCGCHGKARQTVSSNFRHTSVDVLTFCLFKCPQCSWYSVSPIYIFSVQILAFAAVANSSQWCKSSVIAFYRLSHDRVPLYIWSFFSFLFFGGAPLCILRCCINVRSFYSLLFDILSKTSVNPQYRHLDRMLPYTCVRVIKTFLR